MDPHSRVFFDEAKELKVTDFIFWGLIKEQYFQKLYTETKRQVTKNEFSSLDFIIQAELTIKEGFPAVHY